jgi:hypothetical protein
MFERTMNNSCLTIFKICLFPLSGRDRPEAPRRNTSEHEQPEIAEGPDMIRVNVRRILKDLLDKRYGLSFFSRVQKLMGLETKV